MIPGNTRYSPVAFAAALFLASTAPAASILTPYNVVVSGNFTDANTDVGGGLAVGGVAAMNGFSIADALDGESLTAFPGPNGTTGTAFIAAGGATGEASIFNGNWYFSGTDSTFYNNGTGNAVSSNPVTFSTTFQQFTSVSTQLSNDSTTKGDSCTASGNVTTCTVSASGLNIINVADSVVASGQALNINGVSSASWVIINVSGATGTLSGDIEINGAGNNGDNSPAGAQDVLFNFDQATAITLGGSSMGSVLAPDAAVTGDGGQFVGSLVAASFTAGASGGTEFHNFTFQGTTFAPEPAPLACVGAGLIALALIRRRRQG